MQLSYQEELNSPHQYGRPQRSNPPARSRTITLPLIHRTFRLQGLPLTASAGRAVFNALRPSDYDENADDRPDRLSALIDHVRRNVLSRPSTAKRPRGGHISVDDVAAAVADLTRSDEDVNEEGAQYLDAFATPRLNVSESGTAYSLVLPGKGEADSGRLPWSLHANSGARANLYRSRLALTRAKVLRREEFRTGGMSLTPVQGLLGQSADQQQLSAILLGVVVNVQPPPDDDIGRCHYGLEDETGSVPLDLSECTCLSGDGYVTEGCVLLVEGTAASDRFGRTVLHVARMGHAPYEDKESAMDAVGVAASDLFGCAETAAARQMVLNNEALAAAAGVGLQFVVLSEVRLDRPEVLIGLERLFEGYAAVTPLPVFVLMGNFMGQGGSGRSGDDVRQIEGYFAELARTIARFPEVAAGARFVLVPGPGDVGGGVTLPRPRIPAAFTGAFQQNGVQKVTFASNPCRIRHYGREMVFFRGDVMRVMRKFSIVPVKDVEEGGKKHNNTARNNDKDNKDGDGIDNDDSSVENSDRAEQRLQLDAVHHTIKTVLDQSHLIPLPAAAFPVFWEYDHALRLYPPPDALFLADSDAGRYVRDYGGVDVMNPGAFHLGLKFLVHRPVYGETGGEEGGWGEDEDDGEGVVTSKTEFSSIE